MDDFHIKELRAHPELTERMASWFSDKWKIPSEAYGESIGACIGQQTGIPQWYAVLDDGGSIVAGAGVIKNDFHHRADLTPNVCALFVEEEHRGCGIAKGVLDFIRSDLGGMGVKRLYLLTDHTEFYEKCGWTFLTMVTEESGAVGRMYTTATR